MSAFRNIIAGLVLLWGAVYGASALTPSQQIVLFSAACPQTVLSVNGQCAAIDLNFATNQATASSISVQFTDLVAISRASTAYAVDSFGNLISFGSNVLRRTDLGLLIEEARTNYALRSGDPSNGAWSSESGGTGSMPVVTANFATDPTGGSAAARVQLNRGAGNTVNDYSGRYQAISPGIGISSFAHSIYLKSNTGLSQNIRLNGSGGGALVAVTAQWQRFSFVITTTNTNFEIISQGTTGADNSVDLLMWGMDVEPGLFASSYIPTTTAAVARAADVVTAGGKLLTLLQSAAYSAILKTNNLDGSPQSPAFLIDAVTGGSDRLIYGASNTTIASRSSDATVLTATLGSAATLTGGTIKSGIAVNASGRSLVANNGTVATDAKTFGTTGTPTLGGASNYIDGYISRLSVFNSRLPDAALQSLSGP